ncbi:amidohydrolase [Desulfosediminicola sp.]|uniref:amidohydrolase n=1 Tax=Desulfosediminicola sp. TaxID=2886825 RepID=UPI003AF2FB26
MQTLFTNCTLYTGPGATLEPDSYLLTDTSYIADIGPMTKVTIPPRARVINCKGRMVMPGLINSHNHAAMTLFRGLADDLELSEWLHKHIFPAEKAHVNREMVYWCSRLAIAEMILSGTTCVADAYFFSGDSARALRDCGMRAVVGHGIVDFPAPSVPDPKKNIDTVADFIEEWLDKDELITPAVFAHAPYTCSPRTLVKAKALAEDRGVRFFTHIAESPKEMEMIIEPQADTPLSHLAALDILDPDSTLIHAIWLSDSDIAILASTETKIVCCPQSNLKLASGIARVPEMLAAGIPVGLGTDGCASNNGLDMFREMDIFAKLYKARYLDATVIPAATALASATSINAETLGLPKIGRLAKGNYADLIVIDTNSPHLTPMYNADLLVYSARGSDVHSTMIHGRMVMENREILSFDLTETMARVRELAGTIS